MSSAARDQIPVEPNQHGLTIPQSLLGWADELSH